MADALTAIGLASDPHLKGVTAAVLRTDGEALIEHGPVLQRDYDRDLKIWVRRAEKAAAEGRGGATEIGKAATEITHASISAVEALLEQEGLKRQNVDVIGFPGHTIFHRPAREADSIGQSWQIGEGGNLAEETRIDVVGDFRKTDINAGGDGAPLAPIYYSALVSALNPPPKAGVGVVTLGDASSLTYIPLRAQGTNLLAFDCGPGPGLIDVWVDLRAGADNNKALTQQGAVNDEALRMMLLAPYLRRSPPKTLDGFDFKLDHLAKLKLADGVATLTHFVAGAVAKSEKFLPEPVGQWIICGEARKDTSLMAAFEEQLSASVQTAEGAGWRGDCLDAECSAYLAVRSLKKLPLSFPNTTRAPRPLSGGVYYRSPV